MTERDERGIGRVVSDALAKALGGWYGDSRGLNDSVAARMLAVLQEEGWTVMRVEQAVAGTLELPEAVDSIMVRHWPSGYSASLTFHGTPGLVSELWPTIREAIADVVSQVPKS